MATTMSESDLLTGVLDLLRALGCDEFAGVRGVLTFTLGATVQ